VRPDAFKSNPGNHRLSNQRYWTIEGIVAPGFKSGIRFNYDGTKTTAGTYAYLDTALTVVNGDSIGLFYRPNASYDWGWVRSATKVISNAKTGYIEIDSLMFGEYTFGNVSDTTSVGIKTTVKQATGFKLFPNPAKNNFTIECDVQKGPCTVLLMDINGRMIFQKTVTAKTTRIDLPALAHGTYMVRVTDASGRSTAQSLLIE
jgi:hypothetical protein